MGGTMHVCGRPVCRLGFGTMRLTGPGVWGAPADETEAIRVLRRAVELGANVIDTADSYGPAVAEPLIRAALHPYPDDLVIATKAGFTRQGPDRWIPLGRPEYLRQQCEMSLRHLGLERIPLFQLHRVDRSVPLADQVGELADLQREGKIGHIGLSEVSVKQVADARRVASIATVQNRFHLGDRASDDVLAYCEREDITFIPWAPLGTGGLVEDRRLAATATRVGASPAQVALAWLLARSPVLLPIPGTSSVTHLEENMSALGVALTPADVEQLSQAVPASRRPHTLGHRARRWIRRRRR